MVTGFGKFCRKLRIDNSEILSDMSIRLGVSSAFLSKVENGLKKPPKNWEEKIGELYNLDSEAKEKLKEYPLGSQDGKLGNSKVIAKFFNPTGVGTWYIIEGKLL